MSSGANIRHLKRAEIDPTKWDACIDASPNGLVYAYSWYLDAMCDQWDGLVLDDYAAVMSIPWRKKWGIKYVYTPAFVQQLGLIGNIGQPLLAIFLSRLPQICSFGDYHLNFDNPNPNLVVRSNFLLSLNQQYSTIQKGYNKHLQRNLSRTVNSGLTYEKDDNFNKAITNFRSIFSQDLPGVKKRDYDNLTHFCANNKNWIIRKVIDNSGAIVATALILTAKNRYYLLLPAVTAAGRALSAGHFMIDQFIQEHAGSNAFLDFEGSDLPGVKRFYASFGGVNQPYFFHHWNHLPIPLRWIKK
ncbi:hypothetical protein [Paracnuella aquatica]|uniref:hypothetical protein n=1 Tax=Paracnuella aquatica TaxID=2268757 RepID=UPI000DEEF2BC|nr:hypothetical protein [Paracnuella aquatica]RPD50769.1 hypothetical protein DRJ53_07605 [Paracnuella aquatica]